MDFLSHFFLIVEKQPARRGQLPANIVSCQLLTTSLLYVNLSHDYHHLEFSIYTKIKIL